MSQIKHHAFTLVELLIAVALAGAVVLGFTSLDTFGRYQIMSSERLASVQNELSLVADHMSKQVSKAIGNEELYGVNTIANASTSGGVTMLRLYADMNNNGLRDDYWIAYRWSAAGSNAFCLQYCARCTTNTCAACNVAWLNISNSVSFFAPSFFNFENYAEVAVETCWDVNETTYICGEPLNPFAETMLNIKMPSVSIH